MFFSELWASPEKRAEKYTGSSPESVDFESRIVGKTIVAVFFFDITGFDEGVSLECVGCLGYVVMTADLFHTEYIERVAQNFRTSSSCGRYWWQKQVVSCFYNDVLPQIIVLVVERLCFYLIESFPVNADDIGLGYESMIVDLFHEAENTVRFGAFGQYDDYFFGLFGVPPRTVENRYAPVYIVVYAIGYLLVFVGEDKRVVPIVLYR